MTNAIELKSYKGYRLFKIAIDANEPANKEWGIKNEYYYLNEYGESEHFFTLKEAKEDIRNYAE